MLPLILLFLALPLRAADGELVLKGLGSCGLVTRYASTQIPDACLQDATNVYLDEDLGISRRKGFARYNGTAMAGPNSTRGVWPFRATDGTEYMVVLSSGTMYQSNGQGTFTAIAGLGGRNLTQDMDCAQCLGRLWCVNGSDTEFYWDGTSTAAVATAPTCAAVDCFRNRVALGNCSGTLSQLRLSGELDGTDYTIPSVPVSTSPVAMSIGGVNDGNRLQCIMGTYQDCLALGKLDSTWCLYGFDRRDFFVRQLSQEVGCVDNHSAREKQGSLYWLSKRGVEKMTGPGIARVSDPVRDLVDTIIAAGGNSRSATDTSQADFQAGNLTASGPGAPMSITIIPNAVIPTSWTVIESSISDHRLGTSVDISTYAPQDIKLAISTFSFRNGGFELGDFTNFTISAGSWTVSQTCGFGSEVPDGTGDCLPACHTILLNRFAAAMGPRVTGTRTDRLEVLDQSGVLIKHCGITYGNTSPYTSTSNCGIDIDCTAIGVSLGARCFGVDTSTLGVIAVRYTTEAGAYIQTISSAPAKQASIRWFQDTGGSPYVTFCGIENYVKSGTFTSTAYDTGLSTPTWGLLDATTTVPSGTGLSFATAVASATTSNSFDSAVTASIGGVIASAQKRAIKFDGYFSSTIATETPRIAATVLNAGTTGYFISQCRNPGSAITSWGLFQCNSQTPVGSVSFWVSTGSNCGAAISASTAPWTAQTNNTVVNIATAPFVAYRALLNFPVYYSSAAVALQDCTINWNEGTSRPSVAAEVYRDRYYLAYTSGTSGTPVNDNILVLDSRDQWALHTAPNCASLGIYNRKLYCGDSASTGLVYQADVGQDDAGAAFTSSIKTKDFDMGNPFQRKVLKKFYLDLAGLPDPSYAISLTPSYTLDASTDTFSLDPINLSEDYARFIAAKSPATLSGNVTGRWFSFGLTHTGPQGPWKLFGIKAVIKMLKED